MALNKNELMELLVIMLRAKMLEERAIKLSMEGRSPGWIHAGRGQEAVGVGACYGLRIDDVIFPSHRGRAAAIAKGMDFNRALAELLGKSTGVSKGRAGYDFLADKNLGIYNFTGSIGSVMPMATGVALSFQMQRMDKVVVCFFGDGAANHGTFHESLNLASLWKLPIVYVCENNGWAQFTAQEWVTSVTDVAKKAASYNMPGVIVDGDDVLAVYKATSQAISRARRGEGPTLVECKTHRWFGHYVGDPQGYRDKEDIEKCREFDPVSRFEAKLVQEGVITSKRISEIEQSISDELDLAEKFALESQLPQPETAYEHVYKGGDEE